MRISCIHIASLSVLYVQIPINIPNYAPPKKIKNQKSLIAETPPPQNVVNQRAIPIRASHADTTYIAQWSFDISPRLALYTHIPPSARTLLISIIFISSGSRGRRQADIARGWRHCRRRYKYFALERACAQLRPLINWVKKTLGELIGARARASVYRTFPIRCVYIRVCVCTDSWDKVIILKQFCGFRSRAGRRYRWWSCTWERATYACGYRCGMRQFAIGPAWERDRSAMGILLGRCQAKSCHRSIVIGLIR